MVVIKCYSILTKLYQYLDIPADPVYVKQPTRRLLNNITIFANLSAVSMNAVLIIIYFTYQ